ncbi:MAG: dual specificity protein phosphatase family protein [Myxococcales bacterium]|nr:dual specificity protein phosphatase family protein [Myxococcales bacterium]MCB9733529.1 dual specificity protein phosphatase family protein [Deltaproteobacteria bacterium]
MLERFSILDADLAVGSCPNAAEDIDRLKQEAGVRAVVSLQSDRDLEERGLRWSALWQLYLQRGITAVRVPITDFDKKDLLRGLDDAVDTVAAQVAKGPGRVYVHCNAGINRSTSTILGYLVASRGMTLDGALAWLVERHPDAYPYPDVVERWARRRGLAVR